MKRLSKCFVMGLVGSLCLGPFGARADLEVSASVRISAVADFHAPLASHGTWVEIGTYGRCWRPARVAVGWQPYCYGSWVWTDCGWYWASDEPWGWACYHYGNWYLDSAHGWVWVPGIEWAPAWVSWRYGGGYCGWAPLAPRGVVIVPRTYVFVQAARFHEPVTPATVIVNNTTIINQTTEVGSIKRESRTFAGAAAQNVVVNEGPGVDVIRKATGKPVKAVPISEAAGRNPVPSEAVTKINESRKNQKQPGTDVKAPPAENKSTPQPPAQSRPPGQDKKPDPVKPAPTQPPVLDERDKPGKSPGQDKKPDSVRPTPTQPPAPGHSQKPVQPSRPDKKPEYSTPPPPSQPPGEREKPGKPPGPEKKPDYLKPPPSQPAAPGQPQKPVKPTGPDKKPDKVTPPPSQPPVPGDPEKPTDPPSQDKKPDDINPAPGQPPAPGYPAKPAKPYKPRKESGKGNG